MAHKIFFSWQMDIDTRFNKDFIEEALNVAKKDLKKKGIEIQIDYGFRGVSGNSPLLNEMFSKIDDSDIIVSDLTFTSAKRTPDYKLLFGFRSRQYFSLVKNSQLKKSPNPNVLIETGNSWAKKSFYRTILVMNTAFGNADELPVDFKGLRHAIQYNYSESNIEKKEELLHLLALDLKKAIKSAIDSEPKYLQEKISPILLYGEWKSNNFRYPYRCTNRLKEIIKLLRVKLKTPGSVLRLVGPPSSGKTRLAYELFRQNSDELPELEEIKHVLYYDFLATEYSSIERSLQFLKQIKQHKILILDNCTREVHIRIKNDLYGYDLSCITISSEFEKAQAEEISISPEIAKEVSTLVLEEVYQEKITPKALEFMQTYSSGNIKTAISFVDQKLLEHEDVSFNDENYWQRMLGKELIGDGALKVLEILAIFEYVGFQDQSAPQTFTLLDKFLNIEELTSKYLIKRLLEKNILKTQGDYLIVDILPLELAKSWWRRNFAIDKVKLFTFIQDHSLIKPFATRFKKIANSDGATEFMDEMCGPNGSFRDYTFINSELGSRLFLSSVEAYPEPTASALESFI